MKDTVEQIPSEASGGRTASLETERTEKDEPPEPKKQRRVYHLILKLLLARAVLAQRGVKEKIHSPIYGTGPSLPELHSSEHLWPPKQKP